MGLFTGLFSNDKDLPEKDRKEIKKRISPELKKKIGRALELKMSRFSRNDSLDANSKKFRENKKEIYSNTTNLTEEAREYLKKLYTQIEAEDSELKQLEKEVREAGYGDIEITEHKFTPAKNPKTYTTKKEVQIEINPLTGEATTLIKELRSKKKR